MLETIIILAVIAIVVYFITVKGIFRPSGKTSLKIEETPSTLVSVQKIAELVTACFYEEKVLVEKKTSRIADNKVMNYVAKVANKEPGLIADEICLIAKGQVRAGYNLSELKEEDLSAEASKITLRLPQAEILDVIINPTGWDFYVEEGDWSDEEIKSIQDKAKSAIRQDALDMGLIAKAEESGKKKISALLASLGYKEVVLV